RAAASGPGRRDARQRLRRYRGAEARRPPHYVGHPKDFGRRGGPGPIELAVLKVLKVPRVLTVLVLKVLTVPMVLRWRFRTATAVPSDAVGTTSTFSTISTALLAPLAPTYRPLHVR